MAKPGEPFDADEEKKIQAAVAEWEQGERDKEIQAEINNRIYKLKNKSTSKKKK